MHIPYLKWALGLVVLILVQQWVLTSLYEDFLHELDPRALDRMPTTSTAGMTIDSPVMDDDAIEIPLDHKAGVWVVSVLVNDLYEATLIVDSGAAVTILSSDFAFELGLRRDPTMPTLPIETANGTAHGWIAAIRSLQLGEIRQARVPVVVIELSNLADHGIDGLLGGNVLNAYAWRLDHQRRRLVLSPS